MVALDIPEIVDLGFRIGPVAAEAPCVFFSGTGDAAAVAALQQFTQALHEELVFKQARSIDVELKDLYFMNSSCLKAFVSWIHKVETEGRPYAIRFLMNPRQQWQMRSLATLQRLAPMVVSVVDIDS